MPCPYPPPTTIPACTSSAVFCPAFAILSTSVECTVTVCCTTYLGEAWLLPPYSFASLSVTWICPTVISARVIPCSAKNFNTAALSASLLANTAGSSFPASLNVTGHTALSDFTVRSTRPLTVTYRSASLIALICDPSAHPPSTRPSSRQTPRTAAGASGLTDRSVSNNQNLRAAT